ncbi:MAG: autotransporter assembly complex family protein [Pseudomonadota bacterium]
MRFFSFVSKGLLCLSLWLSAASSVKALDSVSLNLAGKSVDVLSDQEEALTDGLKQASRVFAAKDEGRTEAADVLGAALSDYRNIVEALYGAGYYSGTVRIQIDGREASEIGLLAAPSRISDVVISVDPGRPFTFGTVKIGPAPSSLPGPILSKGAPARSTDISDAVRTTIEAWRDAGHPKARVQAQSAIADHKAATLDLEISIDPGPKATLGRLLLSSPSFVREDRIRRIAGFPEGADFSPSELSIVAARLRRSGAFSSVNLTEIETLNADNSQDIALNIVNAKRRRLGVGAEVSSFEGLDLTAFWLHRNLLKGAERLRFDFGIYNIGGNTGGTDYAAGLRYEVPATFGPDTLSYALAEYERLDETDFFAENYTVGIGARRIFSPTLEAELGVALEFTRTEDDLGKREFRLLTFPGRVTWDHRDNKLNPSEGYFFNLQAKPFLGLDSSASGMRLALDGRGYKALGKDAGVVLAARMQLGAILGPELVDTRSDMLFFSGGGGTVRGQPFQSLDVNLSNGSEVGGRSFVGLSGEVRADIAGNFGAVLFGDAGYIGPESTYDGSGEWHAGAGLGLRYQTSLGPIRFDVAGPISGDTGDGVQIYIGIGQAF